MSQLEQPDLKQCQAERVERTPFALGGTHRRTRCANTPTAIAFENKAGDDGQKGSMSLCDDCAAAMVKALGRDFATLCKIKELAA